MINAGEGVEKRELSCTVGGNVKWYSYYGEQYEDSYKTKNRATIWPSNPILGIEREKIVIQKDTCTLMSTAALFKIPKTWKQRKCPSTEE